MKTLDEMLSEMQPIRRKKIEDRTAEILAEEKSFADLRRARKFTRERIAEILGINRNQVSRLEKHTDLLISTLRDCVEAKGGRLKHRRRISTP